jgi:hypothetical protein
MHIISIGYQNPGLMSRMAGLPPEGQPGRCRCATSTRGRSAPPHGQAPVDQIPSRRPSHDAAGSTCGAGAEADSLGAAPFGNGSVLSPGCMRRIELPAGESPSMGLSTPGRASVRGRMTMTCEWLCEKGVAAGPADRRAIRDPSSLRGAGLARCRRRSSSQSGRLPLLELASATRSRNWPLTRDRLIHLRTVC